MKAWTDYTVLTAPPAHVRLEIDVAVEIEYEGGRVETIHRTLPAYYDPQTGGFRPFGASRLPGEVMRWRHLGQRS